MVITLSKIMFWKYATDTTRKLQYVHAVRYVFHDEQQANALLLMQYQHFMHLIQHRALLNGKAGFHGPGRELNYG